MVQLHSRRNAALAGRICGVEKRSPSWIPELRSQPSSCCSCIACPRTAVPCRAAEPHSRCPVVERLGGLDATTFG